MLISHVLIERTSEGFRVSGKVTREGGGPPRELYYEVGGQAELPTPEMAVAALMAAALPSATWLGEELRSEEPCDEEFARRAERIACGIALLHGLPHRIRVLAPYAHSEPREGRVVAASFSGGVDSFYTLFSHRDPAGLYPLGALVTAVGFDTNPDDGESYRSLLEDAKAVADSEGLRFFPVRSNFRAIFGQLGDWGKLTHGGMLASLGFVLSGSVHTYLIPSSYPMEKLFAWGSHPLIDNSYVSSPTAIVHDAWHLHRNEKLPPMMDWPPLLAYVRVCARTTGQRNCGKCEKCIRTKLLFYLNDRLKEANSLDSEITPKMVRGLVFKSGPKVVWYQELAEIARRRPEHGWVDQAIRYAIRRSRWRTFCRRTWNRVRGGAR